MKCPKCGYLGFEPVDRCRNCGYDFSLTSPPDILELPLKSESESRVPLDDLSFLDAAIAPERVDVPPREMRGVRPAGAAGRPPLATPGNLPLFGKPIPDDLPLITRPSPPRQPLAVRRATPEMPRLRGASARLAAPDLGLEPPVRVTRTSALPVVALDETAEDTGDAAVDATLGARFIAVVTDLLILAAIDAAVVYFTMQICGIGIEDLGILPRAPLFAFLLVQNGGYLVALTAGGQTLGKMLAGIKVVSAEPCSPLDLGRAFLRESIWLVLALPAGLGLLTVLSSDRRGVHDRFAGTRVIRASL